MKKIFFALIALSLICCSSKNCMEVDFVVQEGYGPFGYGFFQIHSSQQLGELGDRTLVKAVPDEIAEYTIRDFTFDYGENDQMQMHVLSGITHEGELVIIADMNLNDVYTDDPIWRWPVLEDRHAQFELLRNDKQIYPFEYIDNGTKRSFPMRFHPYKMGMQFYYYGDHITEADHKFAATFERPYHMKADVEIDGRHYDIYMSRDKGENFDWNDFDTTIFFAENPSDDQPRFSNRLNSANWYVPDGKIAMREGRTDRLAEYLDGKFDR